jgi:hypothetical protein
VNSIERIVSEILGPVTADIVVNSDDVAIVVAAGINVVVGEVDPTGGPTGRLTGCRRGIATPRRLTDMPVQRLESIVEGDVLGGAPAVIGEPAEGAVGSVMCRAHEIVGRD